LPDPPWLVPALAELRQTKPLVVEQPFAAPAAPRPLPPRRRPLHESVLRGISLAAVTLCLLALAALAASAVHLLPTESDGPTFASTPTQAAEPPQRRSNDRRSATPSKPNPQTSTVKVGPSRSRVRAAKPKARAKPKAVVPARSKAAPKPKPKPRAIPQAQRIFRWAPRASAVYYQFYLLRGGKTIYQTTTLKPLVEWPAGLQVAPGTYRVEVRPAVPGDAGIILGAAIVDRTIRL
jgi:hypothetical protein